MISKRMVACVGILILLCSAGLSAPIAITIQSCFHKASHSSTYSEDWPVDNGGLLHFFIRNDGAEPDRITDIRINSSNPNVRWMRHWPPVIGATGGNNITSVTVKGMDTPLREGQSVTIEVWTQNGGYTTRSFTCRTPDLRLGNVIPCRNLDTLNIFVRNDGSIPYTINNLLINQFTFAPGSSPYLSVVGGNWTIQPNRIAILKVAYPAPLYPQFPLAIRVRGMKEDGSGDNVWVSAPTRLIEAGFPIGTWSSSFPEREDGLKTARKLQIDMVMGPGLWWQIDSMAQRYHIKALYRVSPVDSATVAVQRGNENLASWYIRDEPDLGGVSSPTVLEDNQGYWNSDSTHPTFLNLCINRAYSEYGYIPDITGMDHYGAFSAPNIIPMTWATRYGRLEEAIEYTRYLKKNTEPLRMWVWAQLAASVWSYQPTTWAANYQFWAHVKEGAKGILWFLYQPGHESSYPSLTQEAMRMTREFSQVRNLCLFGESADIVSRSTGDAKARALVGEDAVVVIVLNNSYTMSGPWFFPVYLTYDFDYNVTVPVPNWIPIEQVYRVTETGSDYSVPWSVSGRNVTIGNTTMGQRSQIFVIGRSDVIAPEAPDRLNFASFASQSEFVLSWREPFDNFGVKGYKIYRDGAEVADLPYPLYEVTGAPNALAEYRVRAYDSAGNLSPLSPPARYGMTYFDSDGYFERWGLNSDITHAKVTEGNLYAAIEGTSPRITSAGLSLDAGVYTTFILNMMNNSPSTMARIMWTRQDDPSFSAAKSIVFDILPHSGMCNYIVTLTGHSQWSGTIKQLRLLPIDDDEIGRIAIDYIGVVHDPALSLKEQMLPKEFSMRAYPNPFNSAVTITLDGIGAVHELPLWVNIFDVNGRRIERISTALCATSLAKGVADPTQTTCHFEEHSDEKSLSTQGCFCPSGRNYNWKVGRNVAEGHLVWRPSADLPSGVYLVRAEIGDVSATARVVYLK